MNDFALKPLNGIDKLLEKKRWLILQATKNKNKAFEQGIKEQLVPFEKQENTYALVGENELLAARFLLKYSLVQ